MAYARPILDSPITGERIIFRKIGPPQSLVRARPAARRRRIRLAITRRLLVPLTTAVVASVVIAGPARASSIVYIKGGNVWLSNPEGSIQRQVTTGGGYSSPSQADDGNIVALHDGLFVHLDRHGNALGAPVNGLSGVSGGTVSFGPQDARVSPDGTRIAYDIGVLSTRYDPLTDTNQQYTEYETLSTAVDRFTDPAQDGVIRDYGTPSWIDNQSMLLTATGIGIDQFATHILGGGDTDPAHFNQWFSDFGSPKMAKAQLTRAHNKLVVLAGNAAENIGIYSVDGPPPATPTLRCVLNEPGNGTNYDDPTWSPDGGELAYAKPDGTYVTPVGDIAGGYCGSIAPRLLIAGASQPFWGLADVSATDGVQSSAAPTTPAGGQGTSGSTGATPAKPATGSCHAARRPAGAACGRRGRTRHARKTHRKHRPHPGPGPDAHAAKRRVPDGEHEPVLL